VKWTKKRKEMGGLSVYHMLERNPDNAAIFGVMVIGSILLCLIYAGVVYIKGKLKK
jgi:hypothetical protein